MTRMAMMVPGSTLPRYRAAPGMERFPPNTAKGSARVNRVTPAAMSSTHKGYSSIYAASFFLFSTGRANSIENLDAQLSAGQIDQATYNTQKGYVCLAQGNATVANLPVLDTYLDRVVEQMNGTPKDQANECLGNVPKSDIASEVFAGAGLGSFRFLTSVWYGTADTVASGITYNVTRIAAEAQDDGYLVSTFYVGCKPYTTQENTQMMVYAILYQKP